LLREIITWQLKFLMKIFPKKIKEDGDNITERIT